MSKRKCFRCGVAEPVLKRVKHSDGQMHLTCNDCAEQVAEMRKRTAARVAELRALSK